MSPGSSLGRSAGAQLFHPGLLSGLELAGASRIAVEVGEPLAMASDNGILSALEVAEIDLRGTDLAVLSACGTGLGPVAGGEGVLGLQRSFQIAGVRNTVVSLWNVNDTATAALMKLFYHGLWKEKKSPLDALRDAQLSIYHHPHRILQLAQSRGPKFDKYVKLVKKPPLGPHVTSPPRLWAAFILAGAGR